MPDAAGFGNRPRRGHRILWVLTAIVLLALASGATQSAAGAAGSLDLIDQAVDADPDSPWWARLRVSGATAGATVVTTVYESVPNRLAFLDGIESGATGAAIGRLEPMTVDGGSDVVRVVLDAEARELARMEGPAVHPLVLSLRDPSGEVLDELTTYVVLTGADPPTSPMPVALVLPFGLEPRIAPDGTSQLSRRDEQQLGVIVEALESHGRTPLTVDVTSETLVALLESGRASGQELLADLAGAVSDRGLLLRPFVRLQPRGWFESGLGSEFSGQIDVATETVEQLLGAAPVADIWLGDASLDAATIGRLTGLGLARFALPGASARPDLFRVSGVETEHSALSVDAELASHIGSTGDPVLDAHRVLADLAVIANEAGAAPAGSVIVPPEDWSPSDPFLNALLSGLETSDLVEPQTLQGVFQALPVTERGVTLEASSADPLGSYPLRLEEVSSEVDGLASVLPEANELVADLRTSLLTSGSVDLTIFEREAYLATVSETVARLTPVVTAAEDRRVTMTGRDGVIPVGLDNQSGRPVRVVVQLRSDKLDFPEGGAFEAELAEGINELEIPVKARTSGDSTLELEVLSPDGSLELSSTTVTVRSTALSGVGLIIAAVALAILLAWWIRNFRSGRRDRRLVEAAADSAEPTAPRD